MSPSRIDELRRRVQNDPASIAFAQLAEEYRRSGQTDDAVRICREGLVRHPGYLSARVTLGRALLDLGELAEARGEFEFVVAEAPENLAAVRGLAEIFHRDGQMAEALTYYERALALARHDPEIEEIVQQLSRQIGMAASGPPGGLSFEEAHQELLSAAERVPLAPQSASPPPARNAAEGSTAPFDFDRLVAALGTPSAPPQLEAVVQGLAAPAIDLPDVVDLGPNPFAALEAELRAHDAVPGGETPWRRERLEPAIDAPRRRLPRQRGTGGVAEVAGHEVGARSQRAVDAAAVPTRQSVRLMSAWPQVLEAPGALSRGLPKVKSRPTFSFPRRRMSLRRSFDAGDGARRTGRGRRRGRCGRNRHVVARMPRRSRLRRPATTRWQPNGARRTCWAISRRG